MTEAKPKSYDGSDITVAFDGNRCLHFAECLRGLPAVFDVKTRPWISPDSADADEVAEVVRRCPSGALHYTRRDGSTETPPDPTLVTVVENGPILLHGNLLLSSRRETRVALCACGQSSRKPFCDNTCHN
ncbi:(4Fe-4S)-binding protein [Kutzneria sp. 744]|uniref:(4Fe-4S)-binding protein n=1 Tax=Kutzneria sp. (strain 744) TaxID=345341 RepID=UPI0004BCFB94|nr:(4Fe-4S)-binding protein [Kutzneria sp. 744]